MKFWTNRTEVHISGWPAAWWSQQFMYLSSQYVVLYLGRKWSMQGSLYESTLKVLIGHEYAQNQLFPWNSVLTFIS